MKSSCEVHAITLTNRVQDSGARSLVMHTTNSIEQPLDCLCRAAHHLGCLFKGLTGCDAPPDLQALLSGQPQTIGPLDCHHGTLRSSRTRWRVATITRDLGVNSSGPEVAGRSSASALPPLIG
jgi:hypothetical protein